MLDTSRPYVVMGLLNKQSTAYAIGEAIRAQGGHVIYSMQNALLKKRYLDRQLNDETLEIRFCDAIREDEVETLFHSTGPVAGVVHSLAYANPKTCLGDEFHTKATEDIKRSYEVSCISLATVARYAAESMSDGGALVALSFDAARAYAAYNWMGVHKAALEALVRALARRHGRDGIRVNAVSAGPLLTAAASKIPGFEHLLSHWKRTSPLPWDPEAAKAAVADAVVFLLSRMARAVTGHILMADGGASVMGVPLLESEKSDARL